MQGLAFSLARSGWRRERGSGSGGVAVAVAVAGGPGEVLRVLPTIAGEVEEPVDLWLLPVCRWLREPLERQSFVRRVYFAPTERDGVDQDGAGAAVPVYGRYREVVQV